MPGAAEALSDPALERIVVSDAVPAFRLAGAEVLGKIEIVPCAPLLATAVARLAAGEPLTDLMVY
jgi:ribose-phosphate pyrophosphokinase